MSQQSSTRRANPMVGWGLGLGAIAGALSALLTIARLFVPLGGLRAITGIGFLVGLAGLVAYFLAGMLTSRVTHTIGSGTIAGLLAGLTASLISAAASAVLILTRPRVYFATALGALSNSRVHIPLGTLIVISLVSLIIGILIAVGLGAGLGALGALAGRGNVAPPPYQETYYPGAPGVYPPPYPGYPPPYAGYPPPPGGYAPPTGTHPSTPSAHPPGSGAYTPAPNPASPPATPSAPAPEGMPPASDESQI